MAAQQITITNPAGLHARPASLLCSLARNFGCRITLHFNGRAIDAKDILGVMAGGIKQDSLIRVVCDGEDECQALSSIIGFLEQLNKKTAGG